MAKVLAAAIGQLKEVVAHGRSTDPLVGPAFHTVFEQLDAEFLEDVQRRKEHPGASLKFNLFINFLIVLNAVLTGIEADQRPGERLEDRTFFAISDGLFFVLFVGEVLVRVHQLGWDYLADPWNVFDYMLVVLNLSDLVTTLNNQGAAGLQLASTLRILRFLRVARVIRALRRFQATWLILQTLLDSFRTAVWIVPLFLIVVYSVAVVITTVVVEGEEPDEHWGFVGRYFGTPWRSLLTVLQVMTLDKWMVEIARPLSGISLVGVVLLVFVIVVCTFGIANLIIAMMVENVYSIVGGTSTKSNTALEETELNVMKAIREEFQLAAHDLGNGELELSAIQTVMRSPNLEPLLGLLGIQYDEAEGLFDILDAEKSGSVSPEEFVHGLTRLKGDAKGQDLVALICICQLQCQKTYRFVERIKQLNDKADVIQDRLDGLGQKYTAELTGRLDASERHKDMVKKANHRQQFLATMDYNREIGWPTLIEPKPKYPMLY